MPKAATLSDRSLIEGAVSRSRLFRGISPDQNQAIARESWTIAAQRGGVLATRYGRLPGVFLVAVGMAKLSLRAGDGEEHVTRVVVPGDSFGVSTAMLEEPCRYEARALAYSKLVVIPSAVILTLIDRDSRFARHIVKSLAERCADLLAKVESTCTRDSEQRLAFYLAKLMSPAGPVDNCTVRLPVSKTVIASLLDMTKETLSRGLHSLSARGLIRVSRDEVAILDRSRLESLVH